MKAFFNLNKKFIIRDKSNQYEKFREEYLPYLSKSYEVAMKEILIDMAHILRNSEHKKHVKYENI